MPSAMGYNHSGFIILTEVSDGGHRFSKKEKLAKPDVNLKCQFLLILKSNLSKKIPLVVNTVYQLYVWGLFSGAL